MKRIKFKIRNLLIKLYLYVSDCDGMCGLYDVCKYCDVLKSKNH